MEKFSYGAVCDQQTGQCHCLPGVVGTKCDGCPHRWVFIKNTGCRQCGPCVHVLLDDTDELGLMMQQLRTEMQNSSSSVFANLRLRKVNRSIIAAEQQIQAITENPKEIDLSPIGLVDLLDEV